jgi:hypothetical protein
LVILLFPLAAADLPANRWILIAQDPTGGRRGSAIRYSPATAEFVL